LIYGAFGFVPGREAAECFSAGCRNLTFAAGPAHHFRAGCRRGFLLEYIVYNLVLTAACPAILVYFLIKSVRSKKYSGTVRERFAFYGNKMDSLNGNRVVWLHAVSVGEAVGAIPLVRMLMERAPDRRLVVTTTTKGGMEILEKTFGNSVTTAYFPFDFLWVARRALNAFHPDALVLMETEIWPNVIAACRRRGVPVLLMNGRVSDRMAKAGGRMRNLYAYVFSTIVAMGMQTRRDADCAVSLGAPEDAVRVIGNIKFDGMLAEPDLKRIDELKRLLEPENGPLMIAGSTHPGEEEIVTGVLNRLREIEPGLRLAIAPRHVDRAAEVMAVVERLGHKAVLRSEYVPGGGGRPVVVLDTIGELRCLYAIGTICFVGGSLVERGGHNILEPAACGRAPFFGPYTMNFTASVAALAEGDGGIQVRNGDEFFERAAQYLKDVDYRRTMDGNAIEVVRRNAGATERAYNLFREFVK
jgi:3-deoxy-D-manno-octulosonic-acid transferase